MAELLKHTGLVINVDENLTATVEVMREHACSGCGEKSSCTMSNGNNVRISFKNASDLTAGDLVEISIETGSFMRSLMQVYAVPLLLMLVFALAADSVQKNQLITAFAALFAPALYFAALKIFRKSVTRQSYRKITMP